MAVIRCDSTVLMGHRHPDRSWFPNVWDFPGGHVEAHETPQEALARELDEELGLHLDPPGGPPDEVLILEAESTRLSVWFIDYCGPVENRCPDEHDELRWVSLESVAQLDLADASYLPLIRRAFRG